MSLDEVQKPSARWKDFLLDVDELLQSAVELHCLGGFVLSLLYDLPRPSADVDYIAAMPSSTIAELERRLPGAWFCTSQETRDVRRGRVTSSTSRERPSRRATG